MRIGDYAIGYQGDDDAETANLLCLILDLQRVQITGGVTMPHKRPDVEPVRVDLPG